MMSVGLVNYLTDERLGKLQAALVQSQDFEDALDSLARWLDGKDKEVSSPKPISARPDVLRRQLIEHEVSDELCCIIRRCVS